MSAMILLSPPGRALAYLGVLPENKEMCKVAHNYQFVDVALGEVDGAVDGIIKANSRAVMRLATAIKVAKYNCIVQVNPVLFAHGIAQCPTILSSGTNEFQVVFDAKKQLKIEDLTYLARFYFID